MKERVRPKIGTAVWIRKDGKVLLGKRLGVNGPGYYGAAGGHLEMNESWEENARRETLEEAGIEIINIQFITATNDINNEDGKHYVTLHLIADWSAGEVENREPHKCAGWDWYVWEELPDPLFLPARNFYDSGYNPFTI